MESTVYAEFAADSTAVRKKSADFAERAPTLTPDGYEVASVIAAPLAAFVRGAAIEMVDAERDGYRFRYGAYRVGEHLVWGATAGILGRLGAFLGSDR